MTTPTENQKTSIIYKYNPETNRWNLQNSPNQDLLNLNSNSSLAEDGAAHTIGAMGDVLDAIAPEGGFKSLVTKGMIAVVEIGYDYARNLERNRELYGEDNYRAELVAFGQATGSFLAGYTGAEIGAAGGAIMSGGSTLAVFGGALVVGAFSSVAYDTFLEQDFSSFLNDVTEGLSENIILFTPNPSTTLTNAQAAAQAIELLDNLSGNAITKQTPIPKKIIVNTTSDDIYSGATININLNSDYDLPSLVDSITIDDRSYNLFAEKSLTQLADSGLITTDATYVDGDGNPVSQYDALIQVNDGDNNSFTLVREDVNIELSDGTISPISSLIEMGQNIKNATEKFVDGSVNQIELLFKTQERIASQKDLITINYWINNMQNSEKIIDTRSQTLYG